LRNFELEFRKREKRRTRESTGRELKRYVRQRIVRERRQGNDLRGLESGMKKHAEMKEVK